MPFGIFGERFWAFFGGKLWAVLGVSLGSLGDAPESVEDSVEIIWEVHKTLYYPWNTLCVVCWDGSVVFAIQILPPWIAEFPHRAETDLHRLPFCIQNSADCNAERSALAAKRTTP